MSVQRIVTPESHERQVHKVLKPGRIAYGNIPARGCDQCHLRRKEGVALSSVGQHVLLSQQHVHIGLIIGAHQLSYGLRADFYGYLGITQLEVAQERRQIIGGDTIICGNDDVAADFFSSGDLLTYLLKQPEQFLAQNVELFSGGSEFQRRGASVDQLHAEALFELFQLIGHRTLRTSHGFRGS